MKRVILDFLWRNVWNFSLVAVLEVVAGSLISHAVRDDFFQYTFGQIMLFNVAGLMSTDLNRGVPRVFASLPLRAPQIGRALWLAAVGVPAIAVPVLLSLGAGLSHLSDLQSFPGKEIAIASFVSFLFLGSAFTAFLGMPGGCQGNFADRARYVGFGALSGVVFVGVLLLGSYFPTHPEATRFALGLAAVLTVTGWFCAGWFVVDRAGYRATGGRSAKRRRLQRAPVGRGGFPFFLGATFVRYLAVGLAMTAGFTVIFGLTGDGKDWFQPDRVEAWLLGSITALMILNIQFRQTANQIRLLRTLPVTATVLAAVLIAIPILPLSATALILAGTEKWLAPGPAAFLVLKSFAFVLAPAALSVFFVVWLPAERISQFLVALTIFGFQSVIAGISDFWNIPLGPEVVIVAACVTYALFLTRRSIMENSDTYRMPVTP